MNDSLDGLKFEVDDGFRHRNSWRSDRNRPKHGSWPYSWLIG